jgi:exopolysaccharide biosynthesis polyprenyl glycosylphosphotransferase
LDIATESGLDPAIRSRCSIELGMPGSLFPTASHPNDMAFVRRHIKWPRRVRQLAGGAGEWSNRGALGMAGPESLLRTSGGGVAHKLTYADVARQDVRERHLGAGELLELHASSDPAVELLVGSLALQPPDQQLGDHDQLDAVAGFAASVPAGQRFAEWSFRYVLVLTGVDALIGGVAAAVPASMSDTLSAYQAVPLLCLISLLFWPTAIGVSRGYRRERIGIGSDESRAVMLAGAVMVAVCALPIGFVVVRNAVLSPSLAIASPLLVLLSALVVCAPIAVVMSLVARTFARKLLHRMQRQGRSIRQVVVAGSSVAAKQLIERIQREPHAGIEVIGLCLPSEELPRPVVDRIPVLGNLHQLADVVRALGCDAVAVASDNATRGNYLRKLAWSLEGAEVELLVDPGLEEIAGPRLHIRPHTGFPLVRVETPHFSAWRRHVKRVVDLVLTSLGLIISAPIMLGIAALIKLQDGGPVIFRQARVGRGGELFTLLKFRSMVIDAEARKVDLLALNEGHGALFKLRDDPRITRLGRFLRAFSLDELPQLFNVLRGSMSLVGPRPHLAHEVAQMPLEANRRSLVAPGITGLWQVSGRSDLEEDDAIRLDLRYVENWSLTYDLQILWKTAWAVLARRGAH